jgi:sirohydrochlorin ferrochelatase
LSPSASSIETAVLVVGHGTRKRSGAGQLIQLVEQMRLCEPHWRLYESFLELAEPTIDEAIEKASRDGVKALIVVPVLLFTAAHAKSDIPDAVSESAQKFGVRILGQTSSLGTADRVIELSNLRFAEVTRLGQIDGCPVGHCSRVECHSGCSIRGKDPGRIGLAMVGRGTSDIDALNHMRELTKRCAASRPLQWFQTGFFAGGVPHVDELLEQAGNAVGPDGPCDTIVIQPHLLFEGELMDQLRTKLAAYEEKYPSRRWVLARSLGADPGLAKVFVEMAKEVWNHSPSEP